MSFATRCSLALLVSGAAVTAQAAPVAVKPGLWEINSRMEMSGGGMQLPGQSVTFKHCIKPEDVAKSDPSVFQGKEDKNCKMDSMSQDGNTMRWKLNCQGQFSGTAEGEVTLAGDNAYQGQMTMNAQMGPRGSMMMTTHFDGKRVGECTQ